MNHPRRARLGARLGGAAAAAALAALVASPASAHVEPTPASVEAGSSTSISFDVEHGCDGSPLVKLEIKVPDNVTDAKPGPAPTGWTGAVAGGVVTFTGGPNPADQAIAFSIEATMPDEPDTSVSFPVIETCEVGTVDWIDPVVEGQEEPENPAPTVKLTAGAPSEDDEAEHGHDEEATATTEAEHDEEETEATTSTPITISSGTPAKEDDDSDSNTGAIIGGLVGAAVIVGGAVVYLRSRRNPTDPTDPGDPGDPGDPTGPGDPTA